MQKRRVKTLKAANGCGTVVAIKPTVEFISAPVGGPKTPSKVLSKQYKARRRRRIVTGMLAVLALGSIAMSFVLVRYRCRRRVAPSLTRRSPVARPTGSVSTRASVAAPVRPVYRHSVVPGGVRSPEEIACVIQRDKVVAAHYKDITPQLMRNERLQQPLLAHVSYRLGDKVYWTKKPVQLPKNEPIMTDGKTSIRERCGNLISMEPLAPVSEEEPALPSFDLLMDPMEFAWMRLNYTPPGTGAHGGPASRRQASPSLLSVGVHPGAWPSGWPESSGPPSTRSVDPPAFDPPIVDPPIVDPPISTRSDQRSAERDSQRLSKRRCRYPSPTRSRSSGLPAPQASRTTFASGPGLACATSALS